MSRRPSTRLLAIARQIENCAHLWPDTEQRLCELVNAIDGWTPGTDAPRTSGTGADTRLTTVEAAAEARLRHSLDLADLRANIHALDIMSKEILDDCQRILRGANTVPPPRLCDPFGREGANLPIGLGGWADPTCREAAAKDGLCSKHYQAERRWRTRNGLTPRDAA